MALEARMCKNSPFLECIGLGFLLEMQFLGHSHRSSGFTVGNSLLRTLTTYILVASGLLKYPIDAHTPASETA